MKIFILGPDLWEDQPVWMSIFWPHYHAISECVPTTYLGFPYDQEKRRGLRQALTAGTARRARARDLCRRVEAELSPTGPNILLVWALSSRHVRAARLLEDVWSRFDHRVLSLVDNVEPQHVPAADLEKFDVITSFCGDLAALFETRTGVRTIYLPPHTDVLGFGSAHDFRPIDLIVVGRRHATLHTPLQLYFNAPGRNRLFLDFMTRTQLRHRHGTAEDEFRILMGAYTRSKAAFCFDPAGIDRFIDRSPLTERWVHCWAAGCTVIGSTPTGRGVAQQLDWPEATLDLPTDPESAIEMVEALLADQDGLARRRRRNSIEALRRHDTRHRLRDLLDHFGLPRPERLKQGLDALARRAETLERGG